MGLFRALRDELTSNSATSNRTDNPTETRPQGSAPVSSAAKAAAEHYRRTGDSSRMWQVKSAENDAAWAARHPSRKKRGA